MTDAPATMSDAELADTLDRMVLRLEYDERYPVRLAATSLRAPTNGGGVDKGVVERVVMAKRRAEHAHCCSGAARDDLVNLPITDRDREVALAILSDLERPAGEGFVLVPVEPTEAMIAAGDLSDDLARETYAAMIAARPSPEGGVR